MTPEAFIEQFPVSRETRERLTLYAEILVRWQARINLVGPSTLTDIWRRHFLDSAQLLPYLPEGPLLDLGSGAGFPGLVLSLFRGGEVHLVESDARKGAFLREAARVMGVTAQVHVARIETVPVFAPAAITARALAPLPKLLDLAEKFITPRTELLFLKGRGADEELTLAAKGWKMRTQRIASLSDPSGVILHLKEVCRGRD